MTDLHALADEKMADALPKPSEPWDAPLPLGAPPPPGFPVDALPTVAADLVEAVAAQIQCDPMLPAGQTLAAMSAAALGAVVPHVGHREPSCGLYVLVAASSGTGKSPSQDHVLAPVEELEAELRAAAEPEIARAARQVDVLTRERQAALAKASKVSGAERKDLIDQAEAADDQLAKLGEVIAPRLLAADTTPEALAHLIGQQGRLFVADDEGSLFSTLCGRYSDGKAFLDCVLKPYSGGGFRIDRVARPPLIVTRAELAILLSVQPDVLAEVVGHREMVERGLFARQLVLLASRPDRDVRAAGKPIPKRLTAAWRLAIRRLYGLPRDHVDVAADPDALAVFHGYAERLELAQRDQDTPEALRGWLAKHGGRTARIATVIHLGDGSDPATPIPASTMARAVQIAACAEAHTQRAICEQPGASNAQRIIAAITAGKIGSPASVRDVQRAVRTFRDAQAVKAALATLADHGWARPNDRAWEFHPELSHTDCDTSGQTGPTGIPGQRDRRDSRDNGRHTVTPVPYRDRSELDPSSLSVDSPVPPFPTDRRDSVTSGGGQ